MSYIHQKPKWPQFSWDSEKLNPRLSRLYQKLGYLQGQMKALGFALSSEASLLTLTLEVVKNSEIENDLLDKDQVRSSLARKLGMDIAGLIPADRHVDGAVEIMLDALEHYQQALSDDRLFAWHSALFPTGRSGMSQILVGRWRDDRKGPMQVISGPVGREKVHFIAPEAHRINPEMQLFLKWFNEKQNLDPLIKAAIAHLWFITIHPFEDGNGRLARTLTDLVLARAENSSQRFYSLSAQIRKERNSYYDILEKTQKNELQIDEWLEWFLLCLEHALDASEKTLAHTLFKSQFWEAQRSLNLNERQRLMLNKLLEGFEGKLSTSKWALIAKCSQDTALRDIQYLLDHGVLVKEEAGGRSTSYTINK